MHARCEVIPRGGRSASAPKPQDSSLFALDVLVADALGSVGNDRAARSPILPVSRWSSPPWVVLTRPAINPPFATSRRTEAALGWMAAVLMLSAGALAHAMGSTAGAHREGQLQPAPESSQIASVGTRLGALTATVDGEGEPHVRVELATGAATATATSTDKTTAQPASPPRAKTRSGPRRPVKAKPAGPPAAKPQSAPRSDPHEDLTADCILDASTCAVIPDMEPAENPRSRPTPAPRGRQTLATADIRAAMAPVKAAAKQCGVVHGAPAGTQISVRLSVEGATGRITRAASEGPHGFDGLGRCVADALSGAQFPTFSKPAMGLVYKVRL